MPQFDSTTFSSQIFWLGLCLLGLCLAMKGFLLPRLASVMEGRQQRLREDWDRAKTLTRELEGLKVANTACLTEAHQKAHGLIRQALEEAHSARSTQAVILDEEMGKKTRDLRKELNHQKTLILENMEPLLTEVAGAAATRLLGKSLLKSQVKAAVKAVLNRRVHM